MRRLFSCDDVVDLIEEIEDGDIEERRCTLEEIDRINRFMALLAKQGILPGDICQKAVLDRDVSDLLSQHDCAWYSYTINGGFSVEPAVYYGDASGVLCES